MKRLGQFVLSSIMLLVACFLPVIVVWVGSKLPDSYSAVTPGCEISALGVTSILVFILTIITAIVLLVEATDTEEENPPKWRATT